MRKVFVPKRGKQPYRARQEFAATTAAVLDYITKHPGLSPIKIGQGLQYHVATVSKALKELRKNKKVKRKGRMRNVQYMKA